MTKLFKAAEIAAMNLPNLPSTKRAIQLRAEKEKWYYETTVGLGGVRKIYAIPPYYLPKDGAATEQPLANAGQVEPAVSEPDRGAATAADAPQGNVIGAVVAGSSQGDMARIELVVRAVSEWEAEHGVTISADRRPAVIAVLYDYVKKAEEAGEGDAGIKMFLKALG